MIPGDGINFTFTLLTHLIVSCSFPKSGTCLRPGFIYGQRGSLPLQYIGQPLEQLALKYECIRNLPGICFDLHSCIATEDVATAVVPYVENPTPPAIVTCTDIRSNATLNLKTTREV